MFQNDENFFRLKGIAQKFENLKEDIRGESYRVYIFE